ncbi:hypothetical protein QCA88_004295 [Escherichia coli]|nr:hypothetical protein [Escherichia coli]
MAPDSWTSVISFGGFAATVLSAIAALGSTIAAVYAIKQSILQRTVSTKPQIIIGSTTATIVHASRKIFKCHVKNKHNYYYLTIPVKNIGLGTALNFNYRWNFDYRKVIDSCGFKEIKDHPLFSSEKPQKRTNGKYIHYSEDNECKNYGFLDQGTFKTYPIRKINNEVEYLIPISQDKTECTIKFPALILTLLNEMSLIDPEYKNEFLPKLDAGLLEINYSDISGNNIDVKFRCIINTIGFKSPSETGPESTFRIEFHSTEPKTTTGLRKLRKSYADFINEHDFNKNR